MNNLEPAQGRLGYAPLAAALVFMAALAATLLAGAPAALAQYGSPYVGQRRPPCRTVAQLDQPTGRMVAVRYCQDSAGNWVVSQPPRADPNYAAPPVIPPGLDPSLAQLPPDLNGRTDPSDCHVVKVESRGFVTVFCRSYQGMRNYGFYCCEVGGVGDPVTGYRFSTLTVEALARRQAAVQAPSLDAPMSGDEAYKIALAFDNHLPRDEATSMKWYEKAARAGNFWAMMHVASQYRHYYEPYGISIKVAANRSLYWEAKAREHARQSGSQREADELRNIFPLPGQQTDYEKFNGALSALVVAQHQANAANRQCAAEVESRNHTQAELEDCGPTD